MTWYYRNKPFVEIPDGVVGFVYKITNNTNGKQYIGKKTLFFRKTRQIKGKKKKITVDSDWQTYYGSSVTLLQDVEQLGKEQFRREIIRLCKSKSEMTYYETKEIFATDALLSEEYYNDWCMCRVRKSNLGKG